ITAAVTVMSTATLLWAGFSGPNPNVNHLQANSVDNNHSLTTDEISTIPNYSSSTLAGVELAEVHVPPITLAELESLNIESTTLDAQASSSTVLEDVATTENTTIQEDEIFSDIDASETVRTIDPVDYSLVALDTYAGTDWLTEDMNIEAAPGMEQAAEDFQYANDLITASAINDFDNTNVDVVEIAAIPAPELYDATALIVSSTTAMETPHSGNEIIAMDVNGTEIPPGLIKFLQNGNEIG
ncbi:MAG: hypothetical protein AAFY76_16720, partial [Cyanobacteria bacterium J06649_11]